jgi:hypothetical protein
VADLTFTQQLIGMLGGSADTEAEPALGADTLTLLLADSLVPDDHGRFTPDPEYVETHDLNRAAGKGWRLKAAKVAGDYSFTIEGRTLNRKEMYDNFIAQAKSYESRAQVRSFRADGGMDPFFLWSRGR